MSKSTPRDLDNTGAKVTNYPSLLQRLGSVHFNQEKIVLAITVVLFATFSLTLGSVRHAGNLISLLQSVAILGVLGDRHAACRHRPRHRSHHGHHHGDLGRLGVQRNQQRTAGAAQLSHSASGSRVLIGICSTAF